MDEPRKVVETLEKLLYASAKAEALNEIAAFYGAARWLIADLEAACDKKGLHGRSWEAILRLKQAFAVDMGFGAINPAASTTWGAMGIGTIKSLLPELES